MAARDFFLKPLALPFIFVFGGAYELAALSVSATRQRRLRRAKPALIREVKQGQTVIVVGTITRAHQPLRAPISQRACVAFSVATTRLPRERETVAVDFEIEDASGERAVVHGVGAQALLAAAPQKREFGSYDDIGDRLSQWRGAWRRPVVITERVVSAGQRIVVRGCADWQYDAGQAHYRGAPLRLHLRKPTRSALLITDLLQSLPSGSSA